MQTRIIITHANVAALKSHPLWAQIMAVAFEDGDVSVTEIELIDDGEEAQASVDNG